MMELKRFYKKTIIVGSINFLLCCLPYVVGVYFFFIKGDDFQAISSRKLASSLVTYAPLALITIWHLTREVIPLIADRITGFKRKTIVVKIKFIFDSHIGVINKATHDYITTVDEKGKRYRCMYNHD
jgi:hypothetical protein